ncbi:hypothetical protein [Lederbergia galactosidilytica]|uniref:Uncharacterized protein n=1 Tax=Lederbergia galactosidilytica TaxID=217031 RepID=A0A177ZH44_9BACI|nr:hypothetical protein [Lederbergia galactosidilytica]OAK67084.1 hypothetical protein ABB05_22265 [Lederbergia galactosidilytica]
MKKNIILIIMLFLLTVSTLIYQWKAYSVNDEKAVIVADESVYLKHVQGQFQIKQVIGPLPNQKYELQIPDKLKDVKCENRSNESCTLENSRIEVKEEEITLTYTLPAPKQKPKSFLLEDWLIHLEGVDIQAHKIQLSEFNWKKGSWVGNTKETTMKEMELLDYYYLEGIEDEVVLYWQQKPLDIIHNHEEIVLYSSKENKPAKSINYTPFSQEPLYLILTDQHKAIKNERLWIMRPEDNMQDLQRQLVMMDIQNVFTFKPAEEWLSEVIAALVINVQPQSAKAKKMYGELDRSLSEEQMKEWHQQLRSFDQKQLESKDLDLMLSDILGGKIRFFTDNKVKENPFSPLIIYDSRKVFLNGKDIGEINVLHKNDKWLIEAVPLLKALNYQVALTDSQNVQADKGKIHYRFYPDKRYFDLNDQRYGIGEAPVTFAQETIMMEMAIIPTLFNIEIVQDTTTIQIKEKK